MQGGSGPFLDQCRRRPDRRPDAEASQGRCWPVKPLPCALPSNEVQAKAFKAPFAGRQSTGRSRARGACQRDRGPRPVVAAAHAPFPRAQLPSIESSQRRPPPSLLRTQAANIDGVTIRKLAPRTSSSMASGPRPAHRRRHHLSPRGAARLRPCRVAVSWAPPRGPRHRWARGGPHRRQADQIESQSPRAAPEAFRHALGSAHRGHSSGQRK